LTSLASKVALLILHNFALAIVICTSIIDYLVIVILDLTKKTVDKVYVRGIHVVCLLLLVCDFT
jgi:hypothetical protein